MDWTQWHEGHDDPDSPLPEDIQKEIVKLHYRWSDELDMQAEPWTM